jgi:tetratricopeptide (TPR) repeat protein
MKLRPTIFLSGVSSEFGSFRDAVEIEVQKKGCFAENQSSFSVDYHTVEEMLRRRINDADAVIHIVGFRFGAEPKDRPADKPRRSYTQMEYDIARELEKPVYVFLSVDASVRDAPADEDSEVTALQLAHRQAIKSNNKLRYTFNDKNELCHLAAEIDVVAQADFRVDISRIDTYAPAELIGREDELALLNDAWLKVRRAESKRPHILTFVALGGEGKTSLVAKWLADLAYENWPGCDSAFAWSFYSQGAREQYAVSSDLFLKEAITFFGDAAAREFAASPAGAYEKGQRLARIVGQRRALLILDGLEPLQYSPTSPTPGELKDVGITALLKGLAANSNGLCIVTTRYSLPNLKSFWQTTGPEIPLTRLSQAAGIHLLKTLGVKGSAEEFEDLVEDVKGHALTLNLLGTYLHDAHGGDIRRRDLVKLEEADSEEQGGHAFRVMRAYEQAFEAEGDKGKRALAILRLLGLFDRPASADCLAALIEASAIPGLTEALAGSSEAQRNLALKRLEDANLVSINREVSGTLVSLDAHPLLREYFARQLRTEQPVAWRAAHRRLYQYLRASTPDRTQPSLEDLQPLYQAVSHACQADLQQEAFTEVYESRITREQEHYPVKKLGAFASDLGAVAYFFERPWSRVSLSLAEADQAWVLNRAAFRLRALGRLGEAREPMRAALQMGVKQEDWKAAAIRAENLTQLEQTLGELTDAVLHAEEAVTYAERSGNKFQQMVRRATYADALHQVGRFIEAEICFSEVEQIQRERQPQYPVLYSRRGFLYCDLLLAVSERAAWQRILKRGQLSSFSHSKALSGVSERAAKMLEIALRNEWLLTIGLDYLAQGRTELYKAVISVSGRSLDTEVSSLKTIFDDSVNSLRRAGDATRLPLGLLTRAWVRFLIGTQTGSESAREDLDEAWEIAERGPMRLHMADIHLYRARLFFREKEYPWESAEADLKAARKLIEQCGYWRRKEELEDAERVILGKSA